MSGIFGIVNLDGALVDRELLDRMSKATIPRGPDAHATWCAGPVALGHALLRDSTESQDERQPLSLDGHVWIAADARIDGQVDLIKALHAAGCRVAPKASHAELILHSYAVFGDVFLQHLIGDFAFALWDSRTATLVCARDHFGVRPFFYAKTNQVFVFGSELDAVLQHPAVSNRLDERAIGDFLLFGTPQECELSIYSDIRRLPAASRIQLSRNTFRISHYWDLPQRDEARYRDYTECMEQFQEVFSCAVNDRARTHSVAIELSGGMDSTSIGAALIAHTQTSERAVMGYTADCHGLLPSDREAHYAGIAAKYLGIPNVEQALLDYSLFERCNEPQLATAEPNAYSLAAAQYDTYSQIVANRTRVLLSGHGGDSVLNHAVFGPHNNWRHALRRLVEVYQHLRHTGTVRGLGLRSALERALGLSSWHPEFPDWIDADFAARTQLHERWRNGWRIFDDALDMRHQLSIPWLSNLFECYEILKMPLIVRHPFFDIRLVDFLVRLPSYMKSEKKILRDVMRGKLPDEVRERPKTCLVGDHFRAMFAMGKIGIPIEQRLTKVSASYIDPDRYQRAFMRYLGGEGSKSTWSSYYMTSPIALNNWLTQRAPRITSRSAA